MKDLKTKTVKNIGFNALANVLKFVLAAVASIILAQRLAPSDYGVVGFAMIFINFLGRFSDLGITDAVIQRNQLDERGLYTGFTTKLILGVSVFAIVFLLSPLAKLFFDNSAIEYVIKVLSVSFIISSFGFLPTCLLTRELNYKRLIIPQLVSAVLNSGLSILLALTGFNYWSIVLANVAGAIGSVIAVNIIHPVQVSLQFDKKLFREFISFGGNLFLSGLIIYLIFNADNFVVGTVIGSVGLGLYAIAFNWGSIISGRLYEVVHNVLFPTFSRIQNDKNKLKESYLKVLEYVTFIGVISNLALFMCAKEFLYFLLGHSTDKWMPALTTFKIMLVYGIIRTFLEPIGNVLMALGKSNLLLKASLIAGAIELVLLYPVAKYSGIEGVAILVTLSYSVQYFIYFPFIKKALDLRYADIWRFVKPTMISITVVVAFIFFLDGLVDVSIYSFIQKLLLSIMGYALFYSAITKWKLFRETVALINTFRLS